MRAGVEQRGTDGKGIDLAERAGCEDRRVVADAMVVRHAGGKGAQEELGLVHLAKVRTDALVGKADRAVKEPNLGILNGSSERVFHQAVRGREDDVVSMFDSRFHGGVEHVRIVTVFERLGAHDTVKVLIEILTSLVVQTVPARRRTGELMDKGDTQGVGRRIDSLAHKEVEHAGGGLGGRLLLIDARRFDKIDLVLVVFAGNDQLAPNLAQAVYDDIRRRIQQAVLVVHIEVNEHSVGGRNVQMVAAGTQVGALKEQEGMAQVVDLFLRPFFDKVLTEHLGECFVASLTREVDLV